MELMPALGGFVLAQLTLPLIIRWLGVLYAQFALEPPETRRAQTLIPLFLLHSGPWVLALLIFGGIKLLTAPGPEWRYWLAGGFAIGCGLMLTMVGVALRTMKHTQAQQP